MEEILKALEEYDRRKQAQHQKDIEAEFDKENNYNNQLIAVKRELKTLGVDAFLSTPDIKGGQPPLEMHAGYSRFVLTLLDSTTGKMNVVKANIHADETELIKLNTESAINYMTASKLQVEDLPSTPAYQVKLLDRTFSGKTPAQVLNENPANKERLIDVKKWLQDNLSKFPKNQDQIDAIDEALDLYDFGTLKETKAASNIIEIYNEDIKIPNASKLNENGKTFVYSISITCDPQKNFPFAITITNCYAKPIKSANGKILADMKSAEGKMTSTMLLTTKEWFKVAKKMAKLTDVFENTNYPHMIELVKARSFYK